jgi:hypothetical protein
MLIIIVLMRDGPRGSKPERNKAMWSMWNAPSDLDYYGQSGFSGEEPEEEQEEELEPPDDYPEPPDDGLEPPEQQEQGEQQ